MKATVCLSMVFVCCIAALGGWAAPTSDIAIHQLRCEYLADPLGIDAAHPRLSWVLQSNQRGQRQAAYRILVATSPRLLAKEQGDLWDSGQVQSDQSTHVAYRGKELKSGMECYWQVQVWDPDGLKSAWSETARWSMGLMEPSDWKAQWIGLDEKENGKPSAELQRIEKASWIWYPSGEPAVGAPIQTVYFRKKFTVSADSIASAQCAFTADNQFALWLNGKKIGLAENFSQLYTFDVTEAVVSGENALAVSAKNTGDSINPAGLIGFIAITNKEGNTTVIPTNGEWRVSDQEVSNWETSNFDDSSWKPVRVLGQYGIGPWTQIQGLDSEIESRRLPARYLRREFEVQPEISRATAYISGLGLYELRLNGQKVGTDVLAPGLTDYDKRALYVTYDVKEYLSSGKNAVGVILGNGRYYAPRLKVPTETRTYGYPKLLLQIVIEYKDGSSQTLVSDTEWKVTDQGPIRANNEYDGEEYDAQMEMTNWDRAGFDDSAWQAVQSVAAPKGALRAQMINPIRVTETIKPIKINSPKPGMYVFDMGQNMVGWLRLKVQGPKGTAVKLRFAELLKDDGTLYLDNIRSAQVTDIYTLKGEGVETYEPRFTYHGFRYVEMTGFPGEADASAIEGCVVHDDIEMAGSFESSNPLLNQIRKNIFWGVRGNYRSFPTDCPQRDERQAWLGDRAAESKGEAYLFDIAALYSKWLADIEDSQKENGSVPSVAPAYWPMYPDDVTWPSCYTIVPDSLYTQYGDLGVVIQFYPGMKKWIDYMSQFLKDGIMPRDTYGDWCVPPESPELIHSLDPARKTDKAVLGTTYFYHNLRLLARYATLLNNREDRNKYSQLANQVREAFNVKFFNKEKAQYDNGSQTSFVLPLAFGMVPEEYKEKVFQNLVHKIENETKGHIGTGLIGGQWLMRVLSDNGRADLAYTIATQTDYPSWGYMIGKGATTIWELWNGDTADPAMNSGNHVMLVGDLNIWFTEYLAGIQANSRKPGFKSIVMKPHPVGDLTFCSGVYRSIFGEIRSEWKMNGSRFAWDVQVPVNTTATLHIPAQSADDVFEGGRPAKEQEHIKFLGMQDGRALFWVESGRYSFTSIH